MWTVNAPTDQKMRKGICTMCNGTDVWKTQDFIHNAFHSDWLHKVDLERYCCLSCGFIAEYISQEDLADAAKMERIRSNFHKA